jgi:dCMP deaminase
MPAEEMNLRAHAEALGIEINDLPLRIPTGSRAFADSQLGIYERAARAQRRRYEWDRYNMGFAIKAATKSKDPSTQVGAYICTPDNRPVSHGYNGFAQGVDDDPERYANREFKYAYIIHGEINAIIFAGERAKGGTLYTWPFPPCVRCAGPVIQAGIVRVVAPEPTDELKARWEKELNQARSMFTEAGVETRYAPREAFE